MSVLDWLVAVGCLVALVALIAVDYRLHRPAPPTPPRFFGDAE